MQTTVVITTSLIWKRLNSKEKALAAAHAGRRDGPKLEGNIKELLGTSGKMHKDVAECVLRLAEKQISVN